MRNILLHHHIFKNAGTSLDSALWRNFDESLVQYDPHGDGNPVTAMALRDFLRARPPVKAVSSHLFHTRFFREQDGDVFGAEFCFYHAALVRGPIDRIVSIYDFLRSGGGHDQRENGIAAQMTLREWAEYMLDSYPHIVCDAQVTIFARHGRYPGPPSAKDLAKALRRLPRFSLIGPVEEFDDTCVAAEYFLAPSFGPLDLAYVRENVSAYRSGGTGPRVERFDEILGSRLHAQLRARNELDEQLWIAARAELHRRLALVPNPDRRRASFAARLREVEEAVAITRIEEADAMANGTIDTFTYPRLRPVWQRLRTREGAAS